MWDPETRRHQPHHEVWVGKSIDGTEVPGRVDAILAALGGRPLIQARQHDADVLGLVHDPALLDWLESAAARWADGPYEAEVGQDRVTPYFFPTPALTRGMPAHRAAAVHAEAGSFCYDTMTLVGPGTWEAARAAVDCALTAAELVMGGGRGVDAPAAYALCRPPGHHATRSGYGGSCYLNNAAVAAEALRAAGHERVGILDLDAHHGNGTQAIFWDRSDVLYGSVHVDPGAGWFPHVFGYADEAGGHAGDGRRATGRCRRAPATTAGWRRWSTSRPGWTSRAARRSSCRSGSTPPPTTPSPLQVSRDGYARAGGSPGRWLRPSSCPRGLPPAHPRGSWSPASWTGTPGHPDLAPLEHLFDHGPDRHEQMTTAARRRPAGRARCAPRTPRAGSGRRPTGRSTCARPTTAPTRRCGARWCWPASPCSTSGAQEACRRGLGEAGQHCARCADADVVEAAVWTWQAEEARLKAVRRAAGLVEEAIRGRRFVARLWLRHARAERTGTMGRHAP
ncbi:MAG: hypothetical protein R2731_03630 [Nocardioides sp.]